MTCFTAGRWASFVAEALRPNLEQKSTLILHFNYISLHSKVLPAVNSTQAPKPHPLMDIKITELLLCILPIANKFAIHNAVNVSITY